MAKEKLKKIDDKARFEPAYHQIVKCGERFKEVTPNIPRCLDGVVRDMHTSYNRALGYVFQASNTEDPYKKLECLDMAHDILFFQQSSIEYITNTHGASIGQMNTVIECTAEAYLQCSKWKTFVLAQIGKN